jgi:hypothetical protein
MNAADEILIMHGLVYAEAQKIPNDSRNIETDLSPETMTVHLPCEIHCQRFAEKFRSRFDRVKVPTESPGILLFTALQYKDSAAPLFAHHPEDCHHQG